MMVLLLQFLCLVVYVLTLVKSDIQVFPAGHHIATGTNVTVTCTQPAMPNRTLHLLHDDAYVLASSSHTSVSSAHHDTNNPSVSHRIHDTVVSYTRTNIQHSGHDDGYLFTCESQLGDQPINTWKHVDQVSFYVDDPPPVIKDTDVDCWSNGKEMRGLWCEWCSALKHLEIQPNMTTTWTLPGGPSDQPELCGENTLDCRCVIHDEFNSDQYVYSFCQYQLDITLQTVYGSTKSTIKFYADNSIVKPDPIENVSSETSPTSATITWDSDSGGRAPMRHDVIVQSLDQWDQRIINISTPNDSITLSDLHPYTRYQVKVISGIQNFTKRSNESLYMFHTSKAEPSSVNIEGYQLFDERNETMKQLIVYWQPLNAQQLRGILYNYTVSVMLNNNVHVFKNVSRNDSHASTLIGRKDVLGDFSVTVYNMAEHSPPAILTPAIYDMDLVYEIERLSNRTVNISWIHDTDTEIVNIVIYWCSKEILRTNKNICTSGLEMKIVNVTDQYTTIEQHDPFPKLYSISTISRRNASSMMSIWTLSGGPQLVAGSQQGAPEPERIWKVSLFVFIGCGIGLIIVLLIWKSRSTLFFVEDIPIDLPTADPSHHVDYLYQIPESDAFDITTGSAPLSLTPSSDSGTYSQIDNYVSDENSDCDDSLSSCIKNDLSTDSLQLFAENDSSDESQGQSDENEIRFAFHGQTSYTHGVMVEQTNDSLARDSSTIDSADDDTMTLSSVNDSSSDSISLLTHTRGYFISEDSSSDSECEESEEQQSVLTHLKMLETVSVYELQSD